MTALSNCNPTPAHHPPSPRRGEGYAALVPKAPRRSWKRGSGIDAARCCEAQDTLTPLLPSHSPVLHPDPLLPLLSTALSHRPPRPREARQRRCELRRIRIITRTSSLPPNPALQRCELSSRAAGNRA